MTERQCYATGTQPHAHEECYSKQERAAFTFEALRQGHSRYNAGNHSCLTVVLESEYQRRMRQINKDRRKAERTDERLLRGAPSPTG